MKIFDKIKEKKAAKEAAIAEEARIAQVSAKCEKDFESYKMFTMANQAKIGTVEEKTVEDAGTRVNTTIAYTAYGPVIKRDVFKVLSTGKYGYRPDYTTYEGYIKSGENTEALSGYFKIKNTRIDRMNPLERETYYFQDYEVINRTALGEVKELHDRVESYEHAGIYGDIVKTFEACIKENIQKMEANQEMQK